MSTPARDKTLTNDILVVDDEADIRLLIEGVLNDEGLSVRKAGNSDETFAAIRQRRPNLVILDIWLQGSKKDGMEILKEIRADYPDLPVIMISGHGNIQTAVEAIRIGAYDFIEKPFKTDRLIILVQNALDAARLRRENRELRFRAGGDIELIGKSTAVNQVRQIIERVAPTGSRVMILGPMGGGKEIAARVLHGQSKRASGPFIAVNCAVANADQLEIELFGSETTGPIGQGSRKTGVFEQAHGGSLYLDEIGDMPLETQGKIVRVLAGTGLHPRRRQYAGRGRCPRRGQSSSSDLQADLALGKIRQDLYYRLSVVPIKIPALVDRRDDIPHLANHFLARASEVSGTPARVCWARTPWLPCRPIAGPATCGSCATRWNGC